MNYENNKNKVVDSYFLHAGFMQIYIRDNVRL